MEEAIVKTYNFNVPVYISENLEEVVGLFGATTFDEMIDFVKNKLDTFNQDPQKITNDKRNKTVIREIEKISCNTVELGKEKGVLLKITASNTNFYDGYYKTQEEQENKKVNLKKTDKVGSDNNFVLLYPKITGYNTSKIKREWIILVYADPNKDAREIIDITKTVLKKVLDISIANIKLPDVMGKLLKTPFIPELELKFSSIEYNDNDVDSSLENYLVKSKIFRGKENTFRNLPLKIVQKLIESLDFKKNYLKKMIKLINGKNEIKIIQEYSFEDDKEKLKTSVEEIFNQVSSISQEDIDKNIIYNEEYIIDKLKPVLDNYLVSYADN